MRECCKLLNSIHKFDGTSSNQILTEKFTLIPLSGQENLNATVFLSGENIIYTDINLKYSKSTLGYYRATATPEIHWKLQQLQDAGNQCVAALKILCKVINLLLFLN